jgi:hypothetical protein
MPGLVEGSHAPLYSPVPIYAPKAIPGSTIWREISAGRYPIWGKRDLSQGQSVSVATVSEFVRTLFGLVWPQRKLKFGSGRLFRKRGPIHLVVSVTEEPDGVFSPGGNPPSAGWKELPVTQSQRHPL